MFSPLDVSAMTDISASSRATTEAMRLELARTNAQAENLMAVKFDGARAIDVKMTRAQLETMLMNAERSVANEESSRVLSQMFGRFSLLQKLIQSMN